VHVVSVTAAISAQDRGGIRALEAVAPSLIEAQFAALDALAIDAYRIGALASRAAIDVVAARLQGKRAPIVLDPVFGASAGGAFLDRAGLARLRERLLPLATLITPNLAEAGMLLGEAAPCSIPEMRGAARRLRERGAQAVLVKGGHLAGEPADVLDDGEDDPPVFAAPRLDGEMRGTGCVLASAIALACARGTPLRAAVAEARDDVRTAIARARSLGGMRIARSP